MKRLSTFFILLILLLTAVIPASAADTQSVIPTISIVSVNPGNSVTVRTHNFPANDTFVVTMGLIGTRGVGGIKVDTIDSGNGGSFDLSFKIPDALTSQYQIAIRFQSSKSGYFAYNWFYNTTGGTSGSGGQPTVPSGYYPTFSIVTVNADQNVTIQTSNLPPNDTFVVTMGPMGTRGINGIKVDTVDSGNGGSKQFKFKIPDALKGSYQISIRMQSAISGYYAFNWFYNNTSSGGTGGIPGPSLPAGTYPTFSITAVVRDQSVTVRTNNLTANDTYVVLMGPMGTRAVNGIKVDTIDSGSGGVKEFTFKVPDALKGSYQIAIRMESSLSGYFAFNWFYNNTYP
jgi:hypothetical protein